MPHVSYSELKNWDTCAFYHKLVHIDKLKIFKGNEYTAFGNAIHDTCEQMLLNDRVKASEHFVESYKNVLKELAAQNYDFNKKLVVDMKEQGLNILPHVLPALKNYFGTFEVIATEEAIYEPIDIEDFNFKGYIDLVLKTKDGRYHVIDWKTCSWGWNAKKKSDKMIVYQLVFYKYFYALKHNIDPDLVDIHFGLLKRTAKKNEVELFKVSSGKKRTDNALNFLKKAVYNIINKKHVKNKLACIGPYGPCEFYKTKHCP